MINLSRNPTGHHDGPASRRRVPTWRGRRPALCGLRGAGVALLMAPAKGKKTRRRLVKAAQGARDSAQDRLEYITDEVRDRVDGAVQVARKRVSR